MEFEDLCLWGFLETPTRAPSWLSDWLVKFSFDDMRESLLSTCLSTLSDGFFPREHGTEVLEPSLVATAQASRRLLLFGGAWLGQRSAART